MQRKSKNSDVKSKGSISNSETTARRQIQSDYKNANDGNINLNLDDLLRPLQAMRSGDFSVRLPGNLTGRAGKVADAFNDIVSAKRMAEQLENVGQVVGREGKTRTRVRLGVGTGV
jgi:hypothetical protein